MSVLITILSILHLLSCVLLIIVVLLQSGRGHGVAGLFGGAGGESPFGAKTGTLLGKVTGGLAAFFIISAVALAILSGSQSAVRTTEASEAAATTLDAAPAEPTERPGEATPEGAATGSDTDD